MSHLDDLDFIDLDDNTSSDVVPDAESNAEPGEETYREDLSDADVVPSEYLVYDTHEVLPDETPWEDEFLDTEPSDTVIPPRRRFHFSIHYVLLLAVVAVIGVAIYKFANWGQFISQEEIFKDGPGTYEDTMDNVVPLITDGSILAPEIDEDYHIMLFGNAPFADDRASKDNLANMIADATGATVYNCSVAGSYLAANQTSLYSDIYPMDAFNFYWLSVLAMHLGNEAMYEECLDKMGDAAPAEARQVYETIKNMDFNTIDCIVLMYDAADYLAGNEMYSDQNTTDIKQFTGNMEAGIELFQTYYPEIRIIVLSPTYAYGIDENGDYISSDIQRYGQDVLSTYVIKQYGSCVSRSVSFIDNLYGTITEDNAKEYLTDNIHLNIAGRKKVLDRFLYALKYYNK